MESVDASIGIGKNRQVAPVGTTEKEESREWENYVLSRRVRAVHTAHARPKWMLGDINFDNDKLVWAR